MNPEKTGKVSIQIPYPTLDKLCRSELKGNIDDIIRSSPLNVTLVSDKIRIDESLALSLFKSTNVDIVSLL